VIPAAGLYSFHLLLDGAEAARIPFPVAAA
jgi:hypothetical protein